MENKYEKKERKERWNDKYRRKKIEKIWKEGEKGKELKEIKKHKASKLIIQFLHMIKHLLLFLFSVHSPLIVNGWSNTSVTDTDRWSSVTVSGECGRRSPSFIALFLCPGLLWDPVKIRRA